jgi:DNA (cytosine-5)-methyltransferase 1
METNTCSNSVGIIDLFAGAGGLGLGAVDAGGHLRLSVELDPVACVTLKENGTGSTSVLEADVTSLSGRELRKRASLGPSDPLIVVGGAPCQPFSKAAYWTEAGDDAAYRRARATGQVGMTKPPAPLLPRADGRRTLVEHFSRLVVETKADGFVFENVPAITHPRNRPMLESLVDDLGVAGHYVTVFKVSAAEFGVPQRRERVFVLGSKAKTPNPPSATHRTTDDRPQRAEAHLEPMATAGRACAPFKAKKFYEPEEVVSGRWAEHLRTVPPGWNYKAHTAWGGHPNPTFVTETRFWNFLLKLHPDLPSWTIAASPGPWTGPFHWESRRLRIPELAALQGFPPSYTFAGSRRERIKQIGNAVPPPVARHMIGAVLDTLRSTSRTLRSRTK